MGLSVFVNAQVNDSFTLNQNDVIIQQNGVYDVISFEGCSYTDEIGNPQLPVKIVSYVLPYHSTIIGIDVMVTQQKLNGNFYVFPAQPPRALDGSDPPPFVEPNLSVYSSNLPYPNKTVEIVDDGYLYGYHVVTVKIYPISYISASGEIYLQNYEFTINYTISNCSNSGGKAQQSLRRAELTKKFIKSIVKNASDVDGCKNNNVQIVYNNGCQYSIDSTRGGTTSAIDILVPDYIIITNNELKTAFQQLANWKTKKGTPAFVKTVEEIVSEYQGSDLQEQIRNYLKEAHKKWGDGLFILLGGDVNIVPARLVQINIYNYSPGLKIQPSDLYYATVKGTWNKNRNSVFGWEPSDFIPDPPNSGSWRPNEEVDSIDYNPVFFLGRVPVRNIDQAEVFVNKIINYEKYTDLGNSSYVNNYLCLTGFLTISPTYGNLLYKMYLKIFTYRTLLLRMTKQAPQMATETGS